MRQTPCLAGYASTFPPRTNSQNGLLWQHSVAWSWCSSGSVSTGQVIHGSTWHESSGHSTCINSKDIFKDKRDDNVSIRIGMSGMYSTRPPSSKATSFTKIWNLLCQALICHGSVPGCQCQRQFQSTHRIVCPQDGCLGFRMLGTCLGKNSNDSVVQSFWNCSPSFHEICAGRTSIECGVFVGSSDLRYLTNSKYRNRIGDFFTSQFLAQSLWYLIIPLGKCHDDAMAPWPWSRWVSLWLRCVQAVIPGASRKLTSTKAKQMTWENSQIRMWENWLESPAW